MLSKGVTIFLLVFMATADWYVNAAEAKFVTKDLVSLWTFDKADVEGNKSKDFGGNNDGEIKGAPQIVKGNIGEALRRGGKDEKEGREGKISPLSILSFLSPAGVKELVIARSNLISKFNLEIGNPLEEIRCLLKIM